MVNSNLSFFDWVFVNNSTYYSKNKSSTIVRIRAKHNLEGVIIPADGFLLCTLPEEIRPKYDVTFAVSIMGTSNTYYTGTAMIGTDGSLRLTRGSYNDSVWIVILYGEYYIV